MEHLPAAVYNGRIEGEYLRAGSTALGMGQDDTAGCPSSDGLHRILRWLLSPVGLVRRIAPRRTGDPQSGATDPGCEASEGAYDARMHQFRRPIPVRPGPACNDAPHARPDTLDAR